MPVTHAFVSAKADDPTAAADGQVLPSHWNDGHDVAVQIAEIDATGTPSSSTYLRGDGTWATPAGSGGLTIGTSSITGGTSGRVLYDNAGTLGEKAVTGSGDVVLATSPALTTPDLGTPSAVTLTNATGLPVGGISATGTPSASTYLRGDGSWATPAGGGGTPGGSSGDLQYNNAGAFGGLTPGTGVSTALGQAVTGSGGIVLATSPTLTTPNLGTPSAATLTNATGLPVSTGLSGLGTGVATFLATPTSANLAAAVTDETGTGALVFASSPTLVTPNLGTPSAATLTNATGLPVSTGISGLGTGVATALAVNVGSAGAPVVNGGALGTPSSGTLTNATGLPVSTGVSGLGTGVATALAVNVGTSGAFVTYGGALGSPSSGTLTNCSGLPVGGITATGTPSSTTYLRGDGTWSTPAGGGGGSGTKTLAVFTPLDNQPPASNFATLDTRNSVALLDFDAGTDESAVFVGVINQGADLSSGIKVRIFWAATSATSGNCVWGAQFEKYGTDIDADSFDTATTATTACSGTSGIVVVTEITCTSIDSLAAGDQLRVKIYRDADNGSDTMTGDAELVAVELQQVA